MPKTHVIKKCPKCKTTNIWGDEVCYICGKKNLDHEVHHIDGNTKNNSTDNLLLVCKNCHKKIHGKDWKKNNGNTCNEVLAKKYHRLFLESKRNKYIKN